MKLAVLKSSVLIVVASILSACSSPDTDVESKEVTTGNVPSAFLGVYKGTLKATAEKGILKSSLEDPITITVRSDNTIEFRGDDPEEVFVTAVGVNGNFNGVLPIDDDGCKGDLDVSGTVNGMIASGEIGGDGNCDIIGSVGVKGSFNASK